METLKIFRHRAMVVLIFGEVKDAGNNGDFVLKKYAPLIELNLSGSPSESSNISIDNTEENLTVVKEVESPTSTSQILTKSEPTPLSLEITPLPANTPATESTSHSLQSTNSLSQEQKSEVQIRSIDEIVKLEIVSTFELIRSIQIGKKHVGTLMIGTEKKDKITGSSADEILVGGAGKDVLKGGDGGDGFLFRDPDEFGKKEADKIIDFDADEGDSVLVDKEVFDLGRKVNSNRRQGRKQ